jgi:Tfp pilus assembly major pilin PilA
MRNQQGVTLIGMLIVGIIIVFVAIVGLKIAPAYVEYYTAKKAIVAIAQSNSRSTVAEVRHAFQLRAAIDNIDVIGPKDLDITKEGNEVVISFAYPKRIPMFGNVNVVIDFAASSNN